mgnify:FL=1
MRNRNTINKILGEVMETAGLTPEMEEKLGIIRDELNERETIIKGTCQGWLDDGEDAFTVTPNQTDTNDYKGKYESLKAQYIERFFNPPEEKIKTPDVEEPTIMEPQAKDISDLFKEV